VKQEEMRLAGAASRKTARLSLRQPQGSDLGFLTDMFSRHELVAHRPDPRPDTPDESAARLTRDMAHWTDHGFGRWTALADRHLVGFGGVTFSKELDGLNLSYHLHPDHWGHGYATELVNEAVRFAFEDLGARRINGLVRTANPASRKVLERCGFLFEREMMLGGAPTNLYILEQ
jgi:RimJ/RimL family protein N-acetyltransferase